jgi:hypothetical protein
MEESKNRTRVSRFAAYVGVTKIKQEREEGRNG